jgi:chromate reductase
MSAPTRRIAVLVGSLRSASINRQLALALAKLAPPTVTFEHIDIADLPPYNQDHDANMPAPAVRLKQEISAADAVLFVTPEYNRSIPGVLKNAIDTASRPYGKSAFAGKPAGVIGASGGAIGTALAQQHLRNVLAYLDMPTLNQPEAFVKFPTGLVADNGDITDASTAKFLKSWVDAYLAFVEHTLSAAKR